MFKFVGAALLAGAMAVPAVRAADRDPVKSVAQRKPTPTLGVSAKSPSRKARKASKKPVAEPVQYAPSGEALPAREKRLLRECKGRPNAGACLGYAS